MKAEAARLWIDERLGTVALAKLARKKEVPVHRHTVWYYFGGMTLFLFLIQVVTGILLLLYYRPSAENAFESVQFIMTEVEFGWLVRSVHSWSANLLIATMFIHMFSVFFMKAYRAPREMTWVTGSLLLFVFLFFGFSGYLLPWNKLAYFATKVGTDIAGVVPLVGGFARRFLRGGEEVTGATLTRFYGFHVAVLPAITTVILGVHALLVQKHGMSVPPGVDEQKVKTMKFVPNFLLRDLLGWTLAIGVLAALAALFPWELGEKADPFASAPTGIRPEWYFLFMFETLKLIPAKILSVDGEVLGVLAFALGGLLWVIVPFLDKTSANRTRSRLVTTLGWLVVLYIVAMTAYGYMA
ncbi:MAG TPA: cytochrome bc complex cytochrome b subunit [Blastocatellia bacterium]|jgi:cytochrome b6|nr:cytochrome bc complex cytochrome b subunit [Blastocatellia bacterium]